MRRWHALCFARDNLVEWSCTFLSKPETELNNMIENKMKSTSLSVDGYTPCIVGVCASSSWTDYPEEYVQPIKLNSILLTQILNCHIG